MSYTPAAFFDSSTAGYRSPSGQAFGSGLTLADGPFYGAAQYGYNGTSWDPLQVDGSKNLKVVLPSALPTGANPLGSVAISGTPTVTVGSALPAGSAIIGSVGIAGLAQVAGSVGVSGNVATTAAAAAWADGHSVTFGSTTDASVLGDVSGTVSAKLRGLSKVVNSVYDAGNTALRTEVINNLGLSAGSSIIGSVGIAGIAQIAGSVAVTGTVTVDSELPAAATLADGAANPTSPIVGAANLFFNGTTWDRARGAGFGDGLALTSGGVVAAVNFGFNGTTYDRLRVDSNKSVQVTPRSGTKSTYMSSTSGTVAVGLAAGVTTILCTLFKPSSSAKLVRLMKLLFSYAGGSAGSFALRVNRITAENGTPGGNNCAIVACDQADGASACTFRSAVTGAPTRSPSGDFITCVGAGTGNDNFEINFDQVFEGKHVELRASQAEGIEVRLVTVTTITTAPQVACTAIWCEE